MNPTLLVLRFGLVTSAAAALHGFLVIARNLADLPLCPESLLAIPRWGQALDRT